MFRRNRKPIRYKKEGIKNTPATLGEEYEKYTSRYSDINYVITNKFGIFGYFLANQEINVGNNLNIPLYSKELIICDFVVDTKAYSKYSKILIDFIIKYARDKGYSVVTFYKSDKFSNFNNFINRYYDVKEIDDRFYLFIDNPRIRNYQKHLTIYDKDNIRTEDLYFLYDLGFDVLKTKCKFKLNENEEISIDRKTGIIKFPSNVEANNEIVLNDNTKTLVFIVKGMYHANDIKKVSINCAVDNYYEALIDGLLYISKEIKEIRDDKAYVKYLIDKGYDRVVPNQLRYNMNESSFGDSMAIYNLIK